MDARTITVVLPVGNRAERRQRDRQARQRTTRVRAPGQTMVNALDYVRHRVSCLTGEERRRVLALPRQGLQALREGVASWLQWSYVSSAVSVAQAIEAQGVVRGMTEHFAAAERALDAIFYRVQAGTNGARWGHTTLYFDEIAALREAVNLHEFQLQQLSFAELETAQEQARSHVLAAGGVEVPVPDGDLPLPFQAVLI
jgi:hypothetical protein